VTFADLAAQLRQFQRKGDDIQHMLEHCRLCYSETIVRKVVDSLKKWTPKPYHTANDRGNASKFLEVRYCIGRLARHMKAAKAIVAAAARFPALFDDCEIQTCPSSVKAKTSPIMASKTTLDDIVIRMLPKDDPRVKHIQNLLHHMETILKFDILKRIQQEYSRPDFRPIVHAELVLLEHLHNKEYIPVGERYIGCSKPACYCCYHYICAHPGRFVRPACHQNIYLNWRHPDIIEDDAAAAKSRDDILDVMLREIRRDACSQIEEQRNKYPFHRDTTTGIMSSASIILDDNPVASPNVDADECQSGDDSGLAEGGSEDGEGSEGEPDEVILLNKGSFL
jgi:OTT_1508-like deaminase